MLRKDEESTSASSSLPIAGSLTTLAQSIDGGVAGRSSGLATTPRVALESWLEKKADWRFSWDRRYCVLDGTRMAYRVDEMSPEKKNGTVVSVDGKIAGVGCDLAFRLWLLEGGCWTLRATDHETYQSWMEHILRALSTSGVLGALSNLRISNVLAQGNSAASSNSATALGGSLLGLTGHNTDAQGDSASGSLAALPNALLSGSALTTTTRAVADALTHADVHNKTALGAATSGTASALTSASSVSTSTWGVPQLTATVMKRGTWTGMWKPRVIELFEGYQLVYKSTAENATARNRYAILTADLSHSWRSDHQLYLVMSVKDYFWVRFSTSEECAKWHQTIRAALRWSCAWHCLAAPEYSLGAAEALLTWSSSPEGGCFGAATTYDPLRVHYHGATIVPHPLAQDDAVLLLSYGGSNKWCTQVFTPEARAFLPYAEAASLNPCGALRALELAGSHPASAPAMCPYEPHRHVKVSPPAVYGCSLCTLIRDAGTTADVALIGGRTGGVYYAPEETEVWCGRVACGLTPQYAGIVNEKEAAASSPKTAAEIGAHSTLQWRRHTVPAYEFPSLAFHDAVTVPLRAHTATNELCVLVTGGIDGECRTRAECYMLIWPDATPPPASPTTTPSPQNQTTTTTAAAANATTAATPAEDRGRAGRGDVEVCPFGYLPEGRAFHRTAVLADGTVVMIGGRGIENGNVADIVLTLPPSAVASAHTQWANAIRVIDEACDDDDDGSAVKLEGEQQDDEVGGDFIIPKDKATAASPWLPVIWDSDRSTVTSLPQLPDVAVASTGSGGGNRVVVMSQLTTPKHIVKLYVLDFIDISRGALGQQYQQHTKQVRCMEVPLKIGAVPTRVVGCTLHVYDGYIYVLGSGDGGEGTKSESTLRGPLRVLMSD